MVRSFLGHDPLSGSLFVFRNRSAQRVKVLWYDRDGLAIYYKRLDRGAFRFPSGDDKVMAWSASVPESRIDVQFLVFPTLPLTGRIWE